MVIGGWHDPHDGAGAFHRLDVERNGQRCLMTRIAITHAESPAAETLAKVLRAWQHEAITVPFPRERRAASASLKAFHPEVIYAFAGHLGQCGTAGGMTARETFRLIEVARECGTSRLVLIESATCRYGTFGAPTGGESDTSFRAVEPCATDRRAVEVYLEDYSELHGLSWASLILNGSHDRVDVVALAAMITALDEGAGPINVPTARTMTETRT